MIKQLKALVLLLIHLFQRALCCFKRRRRYSESSEPLSHVVVNHGLGESKDELHQWNDWEFMNKKPASVSEHIDYYRQQQAKLLKKVEEEEAQQEDVDLFKDMTPKIIRQEKVLIPTSQNSNRISLDVQATDMNFISKDLENWEESSGWGNDSGDWNETQEYLREMKRQEREQKLKMKKSLKASGLGHKLT